MPCNIWKVTEGPRNELLIELAGDEWDLAPQCKQLEEWLIRNANQLNPAERWQADIGFAGRPNARGGGPIFSVDFMNKCIKANLEVCLSEYPPFDPGREAGG